MGEPSVSFAYLNQINSDCYTAYPSTGILPTSLIILAVKGTVVPFIYYGIKEIVRTDKIAMARSQKTGK